MSSRDLLARRRSPARVIGIAVGVVALLAGVGAGLGVWLLPPVLAETPRERLSAESSVVVVDDTSSASVRTGAGWLALGVGPFLPPDARTIVSPDGAYRATVTLLDGPSQPPDAATLAALLDGAGRATAAAGAAVQPDAMGASTPAVASAAPDATAAADAAGGADATAAADAAGGADATDADGPATAAADAAGGASPTDARLASVDWSSETLASGVTVSYTNLLDGSDTITVALLARPDAPVVAHLVLVAVTPTATADRYRTTTADLAATAAFAKRAPR